jgi:hypothetical protein
VGDGEQTNRRRKGQEIQSQQGRRTAEIVDALALTDAFPLGFAVSFAFPLVNRRASLGPLFTLE